MSESFPPPTYTQSDVPGSSSTRRNDQPQILIVPAGNAVNFQKGFLGADDEPAAIEGELQIKNADGEHWAKIAMSLRTVETVGDIEVELCASEVVLFSHSHDSSMPSSSSFPFAIPLTRDMPQSIQTPRSSLAHLLTATLFPLDTASPLVSRTLVVHTKRYTTRDHNHLLASPETFSIEQPSQVDVEIPRSVFRIDESIPVYITVPPPPREIVIEQGLRLRNIRVELVRHVTIKRDVNSSSVDLCPQGVPHELASATNISSIHPSISDDTSFNALSDIVHRTTIAHSGASCRFHSSRPVRLRFMLHQSGGSPPDLPVNLPNGDHVAHDSDAECPSITQCTVLHSVTFRLVVRVAFLDVITRRERVSVGSIPLSIIAPLVPRPPAPPENDIAPQKKHETPPETTSRADEGDRTVPCYSQGIAGPSVLPPPPFEEHDAPPPFWYDERRAPSSARLPSFLELESDLLIPDLVEEPLILDPMITGEGSEFGFFSSEQFDGHSEPLRQEPLPSLQTVTMETNLTSLTDNMDGSAFMNPENGINAPPSPLPPPPPPVMDDPSDPPPCIDLEFRTPDLPSPLLSTPICQPMSVDGYAPPPYLNLAQQENVPRPPPYMD